MMNPGSRLMSLEEKLKSLAEKAGKEEVDWAARRSEWISAVGGLYEDIELWLMPWIEQGYLTVTRSPLPKWEESLGDYEIDTLEITAYDETVVFEPFARNVIGALGRVDVYLRGFKSDAQLLFRLANVEDEVRWELWKSKFSGPRIQFDKGCLERLLDELL
jgi:hypothetical protein